MKLTTADRTALELAAQKILQTLDGQYAQGQALRVAYEVIEPVLARIEITHPLDCTHCQAWRDYLATTDVST